MFGLKLLGGSLLFGICLGHCLQAVKESRWIWRRTEAWIALLTYVRGQIACFGRPLTDILATADTRVLKELDIDTDKGWTLSGYCRSDASSLQAAGGPLLEALAEELGTVWREEQVERLDYYISALEQTHRAYQAKQSEQLRVKCTVVMCFVGGVLLLVW